MNTQMIHAEWSKLRSVRSTTTTVIGSVVLALAFGAIVPLTQIGQWDEMSAAQQADVDPVSTSLIGVLFATLFIGSLAVRSVTGEHTTGMIRQTFAAMPQRRAVYLSKAVIIGLIGLTSSLVANVGAFVIGQGVLADVDIDQSIWASDSIRAIVLGATAVGVVAVLGVGLGGLMRRTAPATALLVTVIIGSQLFSVIVPESARPYVPGSALQATVTATPTPDMLAPATAVLVLALYAAVALTLACLAVTRRDP
ncbi:ABC transporter permease [Aquihabitans daechungensis]|uniref:ABC transporter permease n=1 Tax=Aquihabitans daechungensis TaxID=1052257 RepID=UPI003B9FD412